MQVQIQPVEISSIEPNFNIYSSFPIVVQQQEIQNEEDDNENLISMNKNKIKNNKYQTFQSLKNTYDSRLNKNKYHSTFHTPKQINKFSDLTNQHKSTKQTKINSQKNKSNCITQFTANINGDNNTEQFPQAFENKGQQCVNLQEIDVTLQKERHQKLKFCDLRARIAWKKYLEEWVDTMIRKLYELSEIICTYKKTAFHGNIINSRKLSFRAISQLYNQDQCLKIAQVTKSNIFGIIQEVSIAYGLFQAPTDAKIYIQNARKQNLQEQFVSENNRQIFQLQNFTILKHRPDQELMKARYKNIQDYLKCMCQTMEMLINVNKDNNNQERQREKMIQTKKIEAKKPLKRFRHLKTQ